MSPQADFVVSNGTGAAVRSDINGQLAAIVSNSSGASEPATMYAYQWWADTTTGLLKIRNAANSAWVTIGTLASANLGLLPVAGGTMTGVLAVTAGTAALPGIAVSGDTNTGIYSPGADQIGIATGGTSRIVVDASGNVNIDSGTLYVDNTNNRVGIGTTGPTAALSLISPANTTWFTFRATTAGFDYGTFLNSGASVIGYMGAGGSATTAGTSADLAIRAEANLLFTAGGNTERARIDSSGRLLVGTSSSRAATSGNEASVQIEKVGTGATGQALSATDNRPEQYGPTISLIKSRGSALGSFTVVQNNDEIGGVSFIGTDGSKGLIGARIEAFVDGTPGSNDMPGRLVFSTTADGAANPTERMRIANNGAVGVGDTSPASNTLRASFRGPVNGTESALPVVSIVRTNSIGGGTGVAETGLDVQVPNTFNNAGEVKGINVFAKHNIGTSAAYGIFAESGGNPSYSNVYSGYFKVTQPDTNGSAVNYAVYAQANSTIGVSNSGYSVGVTSETSNYVNNQNFRAVSLYTGASTQTVLYIIRNSSAVGSITTSTTATAYNTSSDYRLKENLVPLTGAIDRLQQIPVHRFNFIADPDRTVDGFIAHETQAVVPEAVHGTKDEVDNEGNPVYQGIDQSKLVPLLTAALQEAIAKIEALETRLSALEAA
jgi:hypothetical protein